MVLKMWSVLLLIVTVCTINVEANVYRECGKLFSPANYMDQLPSLSMPYLNSVPNFPVIKPTPAFKTKVINVVTTYIYKDPVCVKVSAKKSSCNYQTGHKNIEHLVTKEYFVSDRKYKRQQRLLENENEDGLGLYIQSTEEPRPFSKAKKTPTLSQNEVKELLIEDRLDQLETILPHYTRRRTYQTTTITVTKVRNYNKPIATLFVKNCAPQGFQLCPPKVKQRNSKVAKISNSTLESNYFG